jgi:ribosomal protein S18 acetylase RimI-like enzyme
MLKLVPLTEAEFTPWIDRVRSNFVGDLTHYHGLSEDEAKVLASQQIDGILQQGLGTPNQYIFRLESESGTVGAIWFAIRGTQSKRKLFLSDIFIDENQRGKGLGKKAMLLLEDKAREFGASKIGLHVFARNTPAVELYRSLGFENTSYLMDKTLS